MSAVRRAVLGVSVLVLAACTPAEGPPTTPPAADFSACIVSDPGGFLDLSFNQAGLRGLERARDELGVRVVQAESQGESGFAENIESMIRQECDLTITMGPLLEDATVIAAEAHPDVRFAIVDQMVDAENVKPILFETAEAAFLAGYLAAGHTTTGTVGTFGGVPIPSVTGVMDGFVDGVAHYNEVKDADVEVLGWDKESRIGEFTGGFEDVAAGADLGRSLIAAGADVILPVAGPVGAGAAAAAQETGGVAFIGVEADWVQTAPEYADVTLTSIVEHPGTAVFDVTADALEGDFSDEPYLGTLGNSGVALAPLRDFEHAVPDQLKAELRQLRADIIAGKIVVASPTSP